MLTVLFSCSKHQNLACSLPWRQPDSWAFLWKFFHLDPNESDSWEEFTQHTSMLAYVTCLHVWTLVYLCCITDRTFDHHLSSKHGFPFILSISANGTTLCFLKPEAWKSSLTYLLIYSWSIMHYHVIQILIPSCFRHLTSSHYSSVTA